MYPNSQIRSLLKRTNSISIPLSYSISLCLALLLVRPVISNAKWTMNCLNFSDSSSLRSKRNQAFGYRKETLLNWSKSFKSFVSSISTSSTPSPAKNTSRLYYYIPLLANLFSSIICLLIA